MVSDRVVDVDVVIENHRTLWVRLPDGNVIKRHKIKHAVHTGDIVNETITNGVVN